METREIYKEKYQAQIHEWTAKLDLLKARAEKMTAQKKLEAKPRLDSMHEKLDAAKVAVHDIATATDDKWEDVKKTIEHAWTETRAAVEGAYDAVIALDDDAAKTSEAKPATEHDKTDGKAAAKAPKAPKPAGTAKNPPS